MNQKTKFLEDLLTLIEKYGVEFECRDHWGGYAECGQDIRITVEFDDYSISEIDFGKYIDADKIRQILIASTGPEKSPISDA